MPGRTFLAIARVFSGVRAYHSFLLKTDGSVYALGNNRTGQLAIGDTTSRYMPTFVPWLKEDEREVKQASCGGHHSLFLLSSGEVFSCGANESGQLGLGDIQGRLFPEEVTELKDTCVEQVACGYCSSYCLTNEGQVYSFGGNSFSEIDKDRFECRATPALIKFPNKVKILRISVGSRHAAAIDEDGAVWTWGWRFKGQLGRGGDNTLPGKIEGLPTAESKNVIQVMCGSGATTVIYRDQKVFSFGFKHSEIFGDENFDSQHYPVPEKWFNNHRIKKMSIGGFHSFSILENGDIYANGWNECGQLCLGDQIERYSPKLLPFKSISGSSIVDIVCGYSHTIFVTEDQCCYGVGHGHAFGRPFRINITSPIKLLDDVELGERDPVADGIFTYIMDEQNLLDEEIATDMHVWIKDSMNKHRIVLNKALVELRCANLSNNSEICVENSDIGFEAQILKRIYTDNLGEGSLPTEIEETLGIRKISIKDCMKQLYKKKFEEGDVTITSQDGSIYKAHKFVLIARTSYFRSIFRGGWSESIESKVDLEMPLGDSFEAYLKWIYTGRKSKSKRGIDDRFDEFCEYFGDGRR